MINYAHRGAMTQESVRTLRDTGLGVRAWGVSKVDLMKKMCRLEVDGMTVNFPDRLIAYRAECEKGAV